MRPRPLLLLLATAASLATSYREEADYRAPCANGNQVVQGWDPNRPLYMQWWGDDPIPTGANFRDAIVLQPVGGEPIDYWAVSPGPSVVFLCAKDGLQPDTEYEWRVRPFLNQEPNHLPVPFYDHTGIVRFRTATTSDFDAIGSAAQCRRFDDWPFDSLPSCTNAWIDADGDGFPSTEDCDDSAPQVNPGAVELCDGLDNDCDGTIDESLQLRVWPDADGDGFGDVDNPIDLTECEPGPQGTVANGLDCDDSNADINPVAEEVPGNGIDEDCDGGDAIDDTGTSDTGTPIDTGANSTGDTGAPPDTGPNDTGTP